MRTLYLSLWLGLITVSLSAQTQTIRGHIFDQDSQQPLIGATILVPNLEPAIGGVTDVDGNFEIEVPLGRHRLEFQYLGYAPSVVEDAIVNSAKELVLHIGLVEGTVLTEEVVVSARKRGNDALNPVSVVSTRSFSVEETQRYAASGNDPSRMALGFPGVQGSRDARSDIVIRGNAALGLLWRLEGIDIPNPNHFARRGSSGGGITIFSVSMLSNSDFSTGAFPAMYGNALSGVFDIQFRNGNSEKREHSFRAGMLGLDFATEGPIKKGKSSYLFNYRYSTLGILDAFDIRLVSERESNRFQDFSFKLNFHSENGKHLTSVWGIGGLSDEYEEAVEGVENWQKFTDYLTRDFDTDMGVIGVNHNYLIDDKSYLRTGLALTGQRILYRNDTLNQNLDATILNDQLYTNSRLIFTSYYNRKLSARTSMRAGVIASQLYYDLNYRFLLNEGYRSYLSENGNTSLLQPYANVRLRASPRLTINLGLHGTYFSLNQTSAIEPRLGAVYQLTDRASLNLGYGMHSRLVPLGHYFIQVTNEAGQVNQPNRDLDLMRAHHLVLAYDQLLGKSLRLRLETYYQRLFSIPVSSDPSSTFSLVNHVDGYAAKPLVSEGTGTNYGLDITFEQFFSEGTFFIAAASIFSSTYEALNAKTYDTRFNSGLAASFMGGKEWAVRENATLQTGIRLLYTGGQRVTPVLSPQRDPEDPVSPILNEALPFSDQVSSYFRPDLRIAYRKDNPTNAWYLALDVQNFISRKNDDSLDYDYDPALQDWVFGYQGSLVPVLSYQIDF